MTFVGVNHPSAFAPAPAPIFTFATDEFWLNLHSFLHVLGRAQNKERDASRGAVAGAPPEAERGMASMSDAARNAWTSAVTAYANGLSHRDPVFDAKLASLELRLASVGDAPIVDGAKVDASLRATLEQAAPVYRKTWWPAHRAANHTWVAATQKLIDEQGATVLQFITRAYQQPWPSGGYPVHVVAYANWAGAYSTSIAGELLVVSSNPGADMSGWSGLESVFHESMHQWDDVMRALIDADARAIGGRAPGNLSHAMIFFTAGEAVRRVAPAGYVPYADAAGVWSRGMGNLKDVLTDIWLPYLNGHGTRDETIAALVKRTQPAQPRVVAE